MNKRDRRGASGQTPTRKLTIVAQNPSVRVNGRILKAEVKIPNEVLGTEPGGYRVKVVDYNARLAHVQVAQPTHTRFLSK